MNKMREFHWKGINRFQQKQCGKMIAPDREFVEKRLLARGFQYLQIHQNFTLPTSPKHAEITQLIKQLALLINTAIPLKQALLMLQESCQNIGLSQWLFQIILDIEAGFHFSAALEKAKLFLSVQEIQLIKMGELSGNLPLILTNLAQTREQTEKLRQKVKKILFYPVLILIISLTLSLLMLIFIVPQFAELYGEKQKSLPIITELLFSLSQFFQHHSIVIIAIAMAMLFTGYFLRQHYVIQRIQFSILSHLPVFKRIITHSRIIFFCQNCALMLKAHLRLDTTLHSFLSEKHQDKILQNEIKHCLTILTQGYHFSEGLNPIHFSQEMIQMIAIGEQSGQLATMLAHISQIYQHRLDYQIEILSQLLEPILILVMGLIVGTIMVGLYMPIFDLGGMIE